MDEKLSPRKSPCPSCPYRIDVPSGLWHADEYDKLPRFDGDTIEQAKAGAYGVFLCHQANGFLCAGWAGCHDMHQSLALRMATNDVDLDATVSYVSPVPLFGSGAEAAAHGKRDIAAPSPQAQIKIRQLARKKETKR